jgi:hypothetical protein
MVYGSVNATQSGKTAIDLKEPKDSNLFKKPQYSLHQSTGNKHTFLHVEFDFMGDVSILFKKRSLNNLGFTFFYNYSGQRETK